MLQGTSTAPKPSLAFFAQNMPIGSQRKMLYSMLIQGSLTNGTLEWINSYKYWNPTITSITVLFQPNQVMFDNVDSTTNIVTNTDDEKRMIPPNYYTIGVIIVLLNTITDTPISISTKASNYGCIWIQAPYNRFHQCSRYSRNPRFGRVYGHSTCFVLWIKRDRDHSQSPSNPSVFIVGAILQSEDCQPEQQSVHYDNHWWSHDQLLSISGGYLHTDDTRFDRSMFVFKDLEGNIMRLNGLFEWPASRLRGLRGNFGWKSPKRRSYSRETFANTILLALQIVKNSSIFKVFNSIPVTVPFFHYCT